MIRHTAVIAEMASAHDGAIGKAFRLIDAAAEAGADFVKAEFWSDANRLADRRRVPEQFRAHYQRYQVPRSWLQPLQEHATARGVGFLCSTYLTQDITLVAPLVPMFKVSGFEVQDRAFLEAHEPFGKPVIASVPLSVPVPEPLSVLTLFLHVVQAYPANASDLHLAMIRAHGLIGFSDHSGDTHAGADAVLAGAAIVEAHIKLMDTDPNNYDAGRHAHAPAAFARYVANIRRAEDKLGGTLKGQATCEAECRQYRVKA